MHYHSLQITINRRIYCLRDRQFLHSTPTKLPNYEPFSVHRPVSLSLTSCKFVTVRDIKARNFKFEYLYMLYGSMTGRASRARRQKQFQLDLLAHCYTPHFPNPLRKTEG